MNWIISTEGEFTVGEDTFFDSVSPGSSLGVVFEDDLTTGYFYAVDTDLDSEILDAVHIYNVADVVDKHKPCTIHICWAENGDMAALFINKYCHAVFDFKDKAGYSRTGFPPGSGKWNQIKNRKLTDEMVKEILG